MSKKRNEFFRFKQFTIDQRHAAMKVGTDSDLLGALAAGGKQVLDVGTGTGVLALMMAQRFPNATITAIDVDENAITDATTNFANSPFSNRISLQHIALQDFAECDVNVAHFDCIVCNPPYFDRSLECAGNDSRTRARHTSSLPFDALIGGAYRLLQPDGVFSVCIPPEVLTDFDAICVLKGFQLMCNYKIKAVPENAPKRYVLVYKKGSVANYVEQEHCMRNSDRTYSAWYHTLLADFLL